MESDSFTKRVIAFLFLFVKLIHCSIVEHHSHCFQLDIDTDDNQKQSMKDIGKDILLKQLLSQKQEDIFNKADQTENEKFISFTDFFGSCKPKSRIKMRTPYCKVHVIHVIVGTCKMYQS